MIYGAIDIGSNSVRLLVGNVVEKNGRPYVNKVSLVRTPVRLGEDVYSEGKISEQKSQDLIKTMRAFSLLADVYKVNGMDACATAAMREASNAEEIIERIKIETGIEIRIISGMEEAGLLRDLFQNAGQASDNKLFMDLGGGSLEITIMKTDGEYKSKSFKIGSVRLLDGKNHEKEFEEAEQYIQKHMKHEAVYAIGSGGNINALKNHFGNSNEKYITLLELKKALNLLTPLTAEERIARFQLRPDRADVIVPAAGVFIRMMQIAGIEKLYVPEAGLSDAIIMKMYLKDIQKSI